MAKKTNKKAAKKSTAKKKSIKKPVRKPKKIIKAKSAKPKTALKKKSKVQKVSKSRKHVEVISPTKIVRKIHGYSKKDLEEFKKIIFDKRNEIIEQLQSLKDQMMDPTTGQYVNESSPYSLHMAEQGTDAMEREKLYLWAQRENKFLGYLDDALQRIDNGTYGICIECIDEPQNLCPTCPLVPKDRLAAVPHTQHCLQVKQKMKSM
ncbi:MAG: conjugal transfer protein TraR [Bacteroidota bacterium]